MAMHRIAEVQFNGEAADLHELIGRWNYIKGVQWRVVPTDFVGGSFDITFSRKGESISRGEAQAWLDAALKHAGE